VNVTNVNLHCLALAAARWHIQDMKIGAFEIVEPVPELREPHALVMIRPWVDVGSVGSLTLRRMERHFGATELGKLARPGTYFDFTRYRPNVRNVNGERVTTMPNSFINYAMPETGPHLVFMHLLEPHAMAEDYIDSIVALIEHFKIGVYCRIGAMYDSVPHTRPIVVTGNTGTLTPREGSNPPLLQQRGSQYEGPTTIMNSLTEAVTKMGAGVMNLMAHLPHYAQLEEDYAGTARMLEVLASFYDVPTTVLPTRRAERQYREVDAAVERKPDMRSLITRLESYYDSTYQTSKSESEQDKPASLSPEIEQFLKELDKDL
jgi:hypothetical protein